MLGIDGKGCSTLELYKNDKEKGPLFVEILRTFAGLISLDQASAICKKEFPYEFVRQELIGGAV